MTIPPQERKADSREHDATALISRGVRARPLFDREILKRATRESFVKLNPMLVAKNPVMFVVEVGAALTTAFVIKDMITKAPHVFFGIQISVWLWFTVLFANFAEAMAEARGKAQADALRRPRPMRSHTRFCRITSSRWFRLPLCVRATLCIVKPAS